MTGIGRYELTTELSVMTTEDSSLEPRIFIAHLGTDAYCAAVVESDGGLLCLLPRKSSLSGPTMRCLLTERLARHAKLSIPGTKQ